MDGRQSNVFSQEIAMISPPASFIEGRVLKAKEKMPFFEGEEKVRGKRKLAKQYKSHKSLRPR